MPPPREATNAFDVCGWCVDKATKCVAERGNFFFILLFCDQKRQKKDEKGLIHKQKDVQLLTYVSKIV